MSKTREYIEKNAFKHDVIEMDYELLMGTIEAQKEEIEELKKETKHWKANHDNITKRLRGFTCRPDLNVNKLKKEIAELTINLKTKELELRQSNKLIESLKYTTVSIKDLEKIVLENNESFGGIAIDKCEYKIKQLIKEVKE